MTELGFEPIKSNIRILNLSHYTHLSGMCVWERLTKQRERQVKCQKGKPRDTVGWAAGLQSRVGPGREVDKAEVIKLP